MSRRLVERTTTVGEWAVAAGADGNVQSERATRARAVVGTVTLVLPDTTPARI
jgi:hypothetical protein